MLKHFPGYGGNADTHTGISRDTRSYETFEQADLVPFRAGIEAGADADMVLVAKNEAPVPLDTSRLFTKARDSAALYEGIPMHYRVARTYVRGQAVYAEGRITGKQGWGTFVSPAR